MGKQITISPQRLQDITTRIARLGEVQIAAQKLVDSIRNDGYTDSDMLSALEEALKKV